MIFALRGVKKNSNWEKHNYHQKETKERGLGRVGIDNELRAGGHGLDKSANANLV